MDAVNFSWPVFLATIGAVLAEIFFAWKNGTLLASQNKKIPLPLLKHGGIIIGDLLLLPPFNAIVVSYFHLSLWTYVFFVACAFFMTWFLHRIWWPIDETKLNFMSPDWGGSQRKIKFWYRDLSIAGWIHLLFMTAEMVIIAGYIFSKYPANVVWLSALLFCVFIPFSFIEPELVIKRSLRVIFINTVLLYMFVAVITYFKLHY